MAVLEQVTPTAKVLIVDDEAMIREMLAEFLEGEGYLVVTAANGLEGLERYASHQPRVIITDLRMPLMGGLEFLARLNLGAELSTAVIVLTGYGSDREISSCYHLGIQGFLRKPVNLYELAGAVGRAFRLQQAALELQHEVSQKSKALVALEDQHRLMKATFDAISEGAVIVGEDFLIRTISPKAAAIVGVQENGVGQPAVKILGAPVGGPSGLLTQCQQSGERINRDTQLMCRTGRVIPVSLSVMPLGKGSNAGLLVVFRDRREIERSLARSGGPPFGRMTGSDPSMMEIFDLIEKVACSDANVLIFGDSGTGKELVACEIHDRGRRAQKSFLPVNCAAISPELLESEFFGHERGAFTGAVQTRKGRFELAHKGTLFLDEVAEIPLNLQAKLLRVLQERCFERVGGSRSIHVDVRVIAATNKNLTKMVELGSFREDLYYRLHVVPIQLPPLRDRSGDIPALICRFIEDLNVREDRKVTRFSGGALSCLMAYTWPGNVRELHNVVEFAFAISSTEVLEESHLPAELSRLRSITEYDDPGPQNERELTLKALQQTHFNQSKAAALLGINRSTLYRRRLKYKF